MENKTSNRVLLKKFLNYLHVKHERWNILRSIDIDTNFREDDLITEIFLNLIGFPSDNTLEFKDEVNMGSCGNRTDYDNLFCPDWLTNALFDYLEGKSNLKNDDEMIDWLYAEYEDFLKK